MEKKIVRSVLYYSPHRTQGFTVSIRDENGRFLIEHDPQGNVVLDRKKRPVSITKNELFQTLIDSPKIGYQSTYKVDFYVDEAGKEVPFDNDVFLQLEKLADDPTTKIMREDTYKASINPTAFELEKQLKEKDRTIAALQAEISNKNQESSDAISAMQKEMAELKSMLEDSAKPAETETKRGPGRPKQNIEG